MAAGAWTAGDEPRTRIAAVVIAASPSPLTAALGRLVATADVRIGATALAGLVLHRLDGRWLDGRGLDLVVHIYDAAAALPARPVTDLDAADWDCACEAPIRGFISTLRAARPLLTATKGHLVVVTPAVSLEGAAGLVALTTGAEAVRILAKSAARRWGPDGIRVNVVAAPLAVFVDATVEASAGTRSGDAAFGSDARRTDPCLPPVASGPDAVARTVAWLAGPGSEAVTGATIAVDGGALMTP